MTMLSNLLSGLIGGIIGGLLSVVAALMAINNERSQMRQDTSRIAVGAIKQNILTIRDALDAAQWALNPENKSPASAVDSALATIRTANRSVVYEQRDLIANKDLRSRINKLDNMVTAWYENAEKSSLVVNQQGIDSIDAYMACIIESIEAHLDGDPLPPDQFHLVS